MPASDRQKTGQEETVEYFLQSGHTIRIVIGKWMDVLGGRHVLSISRVVSNQSGE